MGFISSAKLALRFDNSLLTDEVSGGFLSASNNSSVAVDDSAYTMNRTQYLYRAGHSFGITSTFIVSFWLYPINPGFAQNPSGTVVGMNMPVMLFGSGTSSASGLDPSASIINIYEETMASNKNRLHVDINGSITRTARTGTYSCGKWHHFLISFYDNRIHIFIDGAVNITGGALSAMTISGSTMDFWINRIVTPDYNWLSNTSKLKDIFVTNGYVSTIPQVQLITNNDMDFFLKTEYSNIVDTGFGLFFNDPSAVKMTDMYKDGNSIFAGRSDGKLVQGSSLLWEVRKDFSRIEEDDVLVKFGDGVSVSGGKLQITDGTVRL